MARVVMRFNNPTLKVADTQAALATATESFECQVTQALIAAAPTYQTIPATGCAGATQSPGTTGYSLQINYLQDWTAGAASLSRYALENDGLAKWVQLVPDKSTPAENVEFEAFVSAGSYGGTFGDGSAGASSSTWPLTNKPIVSPATVVLAADAPADDDVTVDA